MTLRALQPKRRVALLWIRPLAVAFLAPCVFCLFAQASPSQLQAADHSVSHPAGANSNAKLKLFRSERLGVSFKYPAGYKLAAVSPFPPPGISSESIPVAATYELIPPSPPGGADPGGSPYSYQYYVFFLKLDFNSAAKALGFTRTSQGEWTYKDVGPPDKAEQVSGSGWKGLRMSYAFRLYRAPTAQERARGLELGNGYLGMSEGEKTLVSAGGNLSIVLEFDPDIETDPVRDAILKSLRFLKPESP